MPDATRSIEQLVRKTFFPAVVLLLPILSGCLGGSYASFSDLLQRHPSNRLENWQAFFQARNRLAELPPDFIQPASELPLKYGIDMNDLDGFHPPRPAYPEANELKEMRRNLDLALRSQPELKNFLLRRVSGIYLVHDLGSSGLTGFIYDTNGRARAGFILLDLDRTRMSAEEMINLREKSIVQDGESLPAFWGYRLSCGSRPCPGTVSAATYLLFHESAHIATEVYEILPRLLLREDQYNAADSLISPFKRFWQSPWDTASEYEFRSKLRFYHDNPQLSREEHSRAVSQAMNDGFPGLYSTLDVWEHSAEIVAYMMLRRQVEFHLDAENRRIFNAADYPGYVTFMRLVKKTMSEDKGIETATDR
ncbi:MAG: hypothetical protein CMF59_14025 [Leptospiraceae bacterium]|nr:hypothetical protein [Leptospiraceae bacterium]